MPLARDLPDLAARLDALIRKHALSEIGDEIRRAVEPQIVLYRAEGPSSLGDMHRAARALDPSIPASWREASRRPGAVEEWERLLRADVVRKLPLGAPRLGGAPDLPPSVAWPQVDGKRLPFFAQLDCAALPRWAESPLPQDGWLWFFGGGDLGGAVAVRHWRGEASALVRQPMLVAGDALVGDYVDEAVFDWTPIAGCATTASLPDYGSDWWNEHVEPAGLDDAAIDLAEALELPAGPATGDPCGRLLGHVVGDASPAELVRYGGRAGDDWRQLLRVGSIGGHDWGDCGSVMFLIREAALRAGDFGDSYGVLYQS